MNRNKVLAINSRNQRHKRRLNTYFWKVPSRDHQKYQSWRNTTKMFLNIINDCSWYPLHPLDDDITVASSAESSNMAVRMSKDTLLTAEQLLSANKLFLNATNIQTMFFSARNRDVEATDKSHISGCAKQMFVFYVICIIN